MLGTTWRLTDMLHCIRETHRLIFLFTNSKWSHEISLSVMRKEEQCIGRTLHPCFHSSHLEISLICFSIINMANGQCKPPARLPSALSEDTWRCSVFLASSDSDLPDIRGPIIHLLHLMLHETLEWAKERYTWSGATQALQALMMSVLEADRGHWGGVGDTARAEGQTCRCRKWSHLEFKC